MAFFKNRIVTLDELLNLTFDGKGPDEFSFFGIIDKQTSEIDEKHPNLVHHDLILHDGSGARLHVQYLSGYDDETQYDDRIVDDSECPFFPKATTCFLPRLQILYAEDDNIICNFKGGDAITCKMLENPTPNQKEELIKRRKLEQTCGERIEPSAGSKRKIRRIGSNRVCLILEMHPSSIYEFLCKNEVNFGLGNR